MRQLLVLACVAIAVAPMQGCPPKKGGFSSAPPAPNTLDTIMVENPIQDGCWFTYRPESAINRTQTNGHTIAPDQAVTIVDVEVEFLYACGVPGAVRVSPPWDATVNKAWMLRFPELDTGEPQYELAEPPDPRPLRAKDKALLAATSCVNPRTDDLLDWPADVSAQYDALLWSRSTFAPPDIAPYQVTPLAEEKGDAADVLFGEWKQLIGARYNHQFFIGWDDREELPEPIPLYRSPCDDHDCSSCADVVLSRLIITIEYYHAGD